MTENECADEENRRLSVFQDILDGISNGVLVTNHEEVITYVNKAWVALTGVATEAVLGTSLLKDPPGPVRAALQPFHRQARSSLAPVRYDAVPVRTHGGEPQFLSGCMLPQFNNHAYNGMLCTAEDVTQRCLAEQARQESEASYKRLHESMRDAFVWVDMAGNILETNRAYEEMLGYTAEELKHLTYQQITPEKWHVEEAAIVKDRIVALGASGVYHKEYIRKDGTVFPVELSTSLLKDGSGTPVGMWAVVRDITERQRTEAALRRIEWLLQPKPSNGHEGSSVYGELNRFNTERTILDAVGEEPLRDIVRDFLDLLGTSCAVYEKNGDYAVGIVCSGWCRFLDNASFQRCGTTDEREALTCGKWLCHESCWTHASRAAITSGAPVDVPCHGGIRLYTLPIRLKDEVIGSINFGYGDPPQDRDTLERLAARYGVAFTELERRAREYETRPAYIISLAKQRLEAAARLIALLVERKRAEDERARLEEHLRHAQKMEVVGQLAGGVAHDLNNMLTPILGGATMLMQDLSEDPAKRAELSDIIKAANRAKELTQQLLAFARKQVLQVQALDLNVVISGMQGMLRRIIREDVSVVTRLAPSLGATRADAGQIEQVLVNLALNAQDAMPDGGTLEIETEAVDLGEDFARAHEGLKPGKYVRLTVRDTGVGMDARTAERVFEPFFTTKGLGRGTGLGLSTVYGITNQHGGGIDVHSQPGVGTTFDLYFPAIPLTDGQPQKVAHVDTFPNGLETILVVEDEPMVRLLCCKALKRFGYSVLEACNGTAALDLAASIPGRIDLLLTDVIMPDLNGRVLYQRMTSTRPGLKVVFMSGYPENVIGPHGILEPGVNFLAKPFEIQELVRRVRDVLGERVDPQQPVQG